MASGGGEVEVTAATAGVMSGRTKSKRLRWRTKKGKMLGRQTLPAKMDGSNFRFANFVGFFN